MCQISNNKYSNEYVNKKNMIILNEVLINKLESISYDIKYCVNTNVDITQSLNEKTKNSFKFMGDEELAELIEIRKRIKILTHKLKIKLNNE